MAKNYKDKSKIGDNKILFLLVTALLLISLTSASSLAYPIIMSNSGNNVRIKATNALANNKDLTVSIYTAPVGGTLIYEESFENVIKNGSWNVILGTQGDLELDCSVRYYLDYTIAGENVNFLDNSGDVIDRKPFDSTYGCFIGVPVPTCHEGQTLKWNDIDGNWTCAEDESTEMPECSNGQLLRTTLGVWSCSSEPAIPVCANDNLVMVVDGTYTCTPKTSVQSNQSQIADAVGNWAADMVNYYTSAEVNSQISDFVTSDNVSQQISDEGFSGSFSDLTGIPSLVNQSTMIEYVNNQTSSINWTTLPGVPSDLINQSSMESYFGIHSSSFLNSSQVSQLISDEGFSGNFSDLIDIPEFINQSSMEEFIAGKNFINNTQMIEYVDAKDFINSSSLIGYATESYVNNNINSINYSDINNTPNFAGWDTDSSDDLTTIDVVNAVGNWSEDKESYYTILQINAKDFINSSSLIGLVNESYFNVTFARINYSDINNTPVFISDAFSINGNKINLSINSSFLTVRNGQLTFGSSETCGIDGKTLDYNCSSDTWEWIDKPRYLLSTGGSATGIYIFNSGNFTITSDKLGIGTREPEHPMHIVTPSNDQLETALALQNPNNDLGNTSIGILFGTDTNMSYAKGMIIYQRNQSHGRGDFHFLQEYHPTAGTPTIDQSVMTIKNNGNVGIGNTEPVVRLDVNGLIRTQPTNSPPVCDITLAGAIYYNNETNMFLGCNSTTWVEFRQ